MTPKEKAKELLDKFTFASIYFTNNTNGAKLNAKTCALIAVDEIISLMIKFHGRHIKDNLSEIKYWEEVKQEIEAL